MSEPKLANGGPDGWFAIATAIILTLAAGAAGAFPHMLTDSALTKMSSIALGFAASPFAPLINECGAENIPRLAVSNFIMFMIGVVCAAYFLYIQIKCKPPEWIFQRRGGKILAIFAAPSILISASMFVVTMYHLRFNDYRICSFETSNWARYAAHSAMFIFWTAAMAALIGSYRGGEHR